MNKKILDDLSVFLKKNNIMICSSRGEISLLYDVHGPDREMFSTGRNSINAYDAKLLGKEREVRGEGDQTSNSRDFLVMIMPVYFSKYIRTKLAGDFAVSLAEKINGLIHRADGVAISQPPLEEFVWEDFQAGCPRREKVMDCGEHFHCVESDCPLIYLKKFMEKKS